jgi:hypothetical protein
MVIRVNLLVMGTGFPQLLRVVSSALGCGFGSGNCLSLPEVLPYRAIMRTGFCTVYVTTAQNGVAAVHEKVLITCELTA